MDVGRRIERRAEAVGGGAHGRLGEIAAGEALLHRGRPHGADETQPSAIAHAVRPDGRRGVDDVRAVRAERDARHRVARAGRAGGTEIFVSSSPSPTAVR